MYALSTLPVREDSNGDAGVGTLEVSRNTLIRNLICRHAEEINDGNGITVSSYSLQQFLVQKLGIPPHWISECLAWHAMSQNDNERELRELLRYPQYLETYSVERLHVLLMEHVIPKWMLRGGVRQTRDHTAKMRQILSSVRETTIALYGKERWDREAGMFESFLSLPSFSDVTARMEQEDKQGSIQNIDEGEWNVFLRACSALVVNVGRWKERMEHDLRHSKDFLCGKAKEDLMCVVEMSTLLIQTMESVSLWINARSRGAFGGDDTEGPVWSALSSDAEMLLLPDSYKLQFAHRLSAVMMDKLCA